MVEFVSSPEPQSVIQETTGIFAKLWYFLSEWWWLLITSVVMLILGIVIYYIFVKREEEMKERDEPGYALYKSIKRSSELNSDKRKIKKTYSLMNLLWFGLPLKKKEHSAKILNMTNDMLGWYRGDFMAMDSTWNFLAYKKKFLIFIEDTFIIKVPLEVRMKIPDGDKKDDDGKPILKEKVINLKDQVSLLPNGDIKLNCVNLEKIGQYYFVPVYPLKDQKGVLDVRRIIEGAVIDSTNQQMIQRLLNVGAKQMEVMAKFNPYLKYEQKAPEKTVEEKKLEDST